MSATIHVNTEACPVPIGSGQETQRQGAVEAQTPVSTQDATQLEPGGARGAIEHDLQMPPNMQA